MPVCIQTSPDVLASPDHSSYLCSLYFIRQYFENGAGNINDVTGDENRMLLIQPLLKPQISCVVRYGPHCVLKHRGQKRAKQNATPCRVS